MVELPAFRKYDRYKASSYRSYNFKMPARYDSCFWMKVCQPPLWDQTIVQELSSEIRRVLRPGGRILVIDPCFFPPMRQMLNLALRVVPHDGDYHFCSARKAARLLIDLGFDLRRTRRAGWWAYLVEALVPTSYPRDVGPGCTDASGQSNSS